MLLGLAGPDDGGRHGGGEQAPLRAELLGGERRSSGQVLVQAGHRDEDEVLDTGALGGLDQVAQGCGDAASVQEIGGRDVAGEARAEPR